MLFCGSYGKMGAAILASRAAMRSGLGLLTAHTPKCGYEILQSTVPEAMVSVDSHDEIFTNVPDIDKMDAIGIGPGIGVNELTVKAFSELLDLYKNPIVIDADALNILAGNSDLVQKLPKGCILTPHPKEFERLVGGWNDDFERLEKLKQASKKLDAVIVLKGAFTSIASPDGSVFFNSTGNPGMATGGSGDVLTGIITGILAQGYSSLNAAMMGVYLQGLSGDMAVLDKGMEAMIASDLIDYLPKAFHRIDH
jgi:NAD(P)H-hydrate epimerase